MGYYANTVLADSPLLYFRYDDDNLATNVGSRSGSSVVSSGGYAFGTGRQGRAPDFTGPSVASHIRYDFNGNSQFNSNNWTIEFWFRVDAFPSGYMSLFQINDGARDMIDALFDYGIGRNLIVRHRGTDNAFYSFTTSHVQDNNWHHFVLVRNGTAMTCYVDGSNVGGGTIGATTNFVSSQQFGFASWGTSAGNDNFNGALDELAIYNTSLSSTRITAHKNAGLGTHADFAPSPLAVSVDFPAGALHITKTFVASAMTASVAMPTHTFSAVKNVAFSAGAMGVSVATTPAVFVNRVSTVPHTRTTTVRTTGYENATYGGIQLGNAYDGWMEIDLSSLPGDATLGHATLELYYNTSVNADLNVIVDSVDADFDPATITQSNKPATGAITQSMTLPYGFSVTRHATIDISDIVAGIKAGTVFGLHIRSTTGDAVVNDSTYVEVNFYATGIINLTAEPFTVDVATTDPTVTTTRGAYPTIAPMTVNIAAVQPLIDASRSVSIPTGAMSLSVTMPSVFVYIPDAHVNAGTMNVGVTLPEEFFVYAGTDAINAVESMIVTLDVVEGSFSNQTDRLIGVDAMSIHTLFVGIYDPEDDMYYQNVLERLTAPFVSSTILEGTKRFYDFRLGNPYPDEVLGTPEVMTPGYRGRKGMVFSGDDYINVPVAGGDQFLSYRVYEAGLGGVEFGISTTQTSGVLVASRDNSLNLEIDDGYIVVTTGFQRLRTPVLINDGEFHHIAWFTQPGGGRTFLMVDGVIRWGRYGGTTSIARFGKRWSNTFGGSTLPAKPNFVGELVDLIPWNSYFDQETFKQAYYDWSETHLVNVPAMVGPYVEMPQDVRGKGNTPRMLVLYGLSTGRDSNGGRYYPYQSPTSGLIIPGGNSSNPAFLPATNLYGQALPIRATQPFDYAGYRAFPIHMIDPQGSAAGLIKGQDSLDSRGIDFFYLGDEGLPEFIDLDRDLAEPISHYDLIHVLNWPDENLGSFEANTMNQGTENPPAIESDLLTESVYDQMREKFINSILSAVSQGVSLWVSDPRMAVDLGIAEQFDVHVTPLEEPDPQSELRDRQETSGAVNGTSDNVDGTAGGRGYYEDHNSIHFRRIVDTADHFSELPSFYVSDMAYYHDNDRLKSYADTYAHNLVELEDGLVIGSEFPLGDRMGFGYSAHRNNADPKGIVSFRPTAGLKGKVIAKEQLSYFRGLDAVENPYKDNVTTLLLDPDDHWTLKGFPVNGRIFVETMDVGPDGYLDPIRHTEESKGLWRGIPIIEPVGGTKFVHQPAPTPGDPYRTVIIEVPNDAYQDGRGVWISTVGESRWDYDSRRYRESISMQQTISKVSRPSKNVKTTYNVKSTTESYDSGIYQVTIVEDGVETEHLPLFSMAERGLGWMQAFSQERADDAGSATVRPTAMGVTVEGTPNEMVRITRNIKPEITPMKVRVESRDITNGFDPNTTVFAEAMEVGPITVVKTSTIPPIGPMNITVELLDVYRELEQGYDFTVFAPDYDMTLYLGED